MAESSGRRRPSARTRAARGSRSSSDSRKAEEGLSRADSRLAREERSRARAEEAALEAQARAEQAASLTGANRSGHHATKRSTQPASDGGKRAQMPTNRASKSRSVSRETPVNSGKTVHPESRGERLTASQTRRPTPRGQKVPASQSQPRSQSQTAKRQATRHTTNSQQPQQSQQSQQSRQPQQRRPRPQPRPDSAQAQAQPQPQSEPQRQPHPLSRLKGRTVAIAAICVACAIGIGLLVTLIVGAVTAPPRAVPDAEPGLTVYDVDASDPESSPPLTTGETTVSLSAVGDNLMHLPVVETADLAEGDLGDNKFDFSVIYSGLSEIIASHDINFIDIETPMGGDDLGYSGYPVFNTPSDDAADIASSGFNLATTATNHAWDQGFEGIQSMSQTWASHPEVVVAGTYTNQADRDNIRTFSKNGLTFAFLAYQDDLNGFTLPSNQKWAVGDSNDTEQVKEDIRKAHELAECVIVAMSWGDEYSFEPNESQQETAQLFADEGVDLVLGFGPHVIQPVEWVQGKGKGTDADGQSVDHKTLVVYSLGNYVSNQQQTFNLVEGCFTCNFVRDAEGVISIQDPTWIPLVGHIEAGGVNYGTTAHNAYPIYDYTEEMAKRNYVLGSLDDPLKYVRDTTLEVIDPKVVTIDFGGSGGTGDADGSTDTGEADVTNEVVTNETVPADNEPMTVQ